MFNIGPVELIVLLAIGLIFLGPEKFPEFVKIVMRAVRDFKGYINDVKRDLADELNPVKTEIKQLSRYNPEDYVEKLTSAIMTDDDPKKKEPEHSSGESGTASAEGSVSYQSHSASPNEESSKTDTKVEQEYPD